MNVTGGASGSKWGHVSVGVCESECVFVCLFMSFNTHTTILYNMSRKDLVCPQCTACQVQHAKNTSLPYCIQSHFAECTRSVCCSPTVPSTVEVTLQWLKCWESAGRSKLRDDRGHKNRWQHISVSNTCYVTCVSTSNIYSATMYRLHQMFEQES